MPEPPKFNSFLDRIQKILEQYTTKDGIHPKCEFGFILHILEVFDFPETVCLQIFPRIFATGMGTKPYTTCTVNRQEYHNKSEPIDPNYTLDSWDQMCSADESWEYLLKQEI
jgi:hypothetical protein